MQVDRWLMLQPGPRISHNPPRNIHARACGVLGTPRSSNHIFFLGQSSNYRVEFLPLNSNKSCSWRFLHQYLRALCPEAETPFRVSVATVRDRPVHPVPRSSRISDYQIGGGWGRSRRQRSPGDLASSSSLLSSHELHREASSCTLKRQRPGSWARKPTLQTKADLVLLLVCPFRAEREEAATVAIIGSPTPRTQAQNDRFHMQRRSQCYHVSRWTAC